MTLELAATILKWTGGLLAYSTLGIVLYGIWRGTRRPAGRTTGWMGAWMRSPWFYVASVVVFFGICWIGWIPIQMSISPPIRGFMLVLGALCYFPGMLLVLWGRLALGKNYFVSSGFGAQLFSDHQLVTRGPYAIVRHPMYAGLILAAAGSLLIYFTVTSLLFVCFAPFIIVRAHREETALAAEFGEELRAYCNRVAAFIPRLSRTRIPK